MTPLPKPGTRWKSKDGKRAVTVQHITGKPEATGVSFKVEVERFSTVEYLTLAVFLKSYEPADAGDRT